MTVRSHFTRPEVNDYTNGHSTRPDKLLQDLAAETALRFPDVIRYQTAPEMGTLLGLLAGMSGARTAIEVGTFTGYSSIVLARALGPDGHLVTCDVNPEWTGLAGEYWARAGLSGRIELRLGPGLQTLASLPEEELFDLAFVDANKGDYPGYWTAIVPRVKSGGLILVDNVLFYGRVLDGTDHDPEVEAIRAMNEMARDDDRVTLVIVSIGDGLTIARKHARRL